VIAVILNPRSRSVRRDPTFAERLRRICGPTGEVHAPESREALRSLVSSLKGVRHLALHGGDGTGHQVLTALRQAGVEELPELMWLHGGTMNTVSRSMGQVGHAESQLSAWVTELRGGPSLLRTRRWPLQVDDGNAGFLFGIGIVPRFIEAYEADGEPTPVKAAVTLGRAVLSAFTGGAFARSFFRGIEAHVEGDGVVWPRRAWRILTAGAVDQIGLSFRPFPGVLRHPGQMHVFGSASSPVGFARDLVPLFRGQPARDPGAHDQVCRRLVIEADEPLRYNLDGDLYTAGRRLTVETGAPATFVLAPGARPPENVLGP
jgi:diacylglycerol kinase (ATP)